VLVNCGVGPLSQRGLDEAFGFAVGPWSIRLGEEVTDLKFTEVGGDVLGAVGATVVSHEAANPNAEGGEVIEGVVEEAANAVVGLVGKDLGKGDARAIVDGDMDVLPTGASDTIPAVASDAVAGSYNAAKLFDVHVEEFAWTLALITDDRLCRLQGRELGETVTGQEPANSGLGKAALLGDLEARQTHPAQGQDNGHLGIGGPTGTLIWARTTVLKTLNSVLAIARHPLGHRALAYMEGGRGLLPCKPLIEHGIDHRRSTSRQKACVIMDVHVAVVAEGWALSHTHSLNSPSHEQPPETSQLARDKKDYLQQLAQLKADAVSTNNSGLAAAVSQEITSMGGTDTGGTNVAGDGLGGTDEPTIESITARLVNTTWAWNGGETFTLLPDGRAKWSGTAAATMTWKVVGSSPPKVEGIAQNGNKYKMTLDADLQSGKLIEGTSAVRITARIDAK
jgi:hypothetical protein